MTRCGREQLPIVALLVVGRPGDDGPFTQTEIFIGNHQVGVDRLFSPQPLAVGAGAMRTIEAEGAWLDLRNAGAVVDTGEMFGVEAVDRIFTVGDVVDNDHAPTHL